MKKLFLFDAFALVYRAHFAFSRNPRINSKGLNTGVMLGFTNTLLDVIKKEKPSHMAVAFDSKEPTFRHDTFPQYKANREAQPEDIGIALPHVRNIIQAFNIPILELAGYEADDIIGTVAKKLSEQYFEIYMMTPDKDYGQLVGKHIFLYKPAYMGNSVDILGVPEILAKWSIQRVEQVADMLGLQGDSSDNIPGIPGIGAKTATKLLAEFDTVENLVKNADKLKGKQKERVVAFGQQGILSKKLATIDTSVPIDFNTESMLYNGFNEAALKAIFQELEFRTLSNRLFNNTKNTESKPKPIAVTQGILFDKAIPVSKHSEEKSELKNIDNTLHDYQLIDTPELYRSLMYFLSIQQEFCFDTETTKVSPYEAELVGLAFSYYPNEAYYVPIPEDRKAAQKIVNIFKPVFENESIIKVGQNIKYDNIVLQSYGITVKGKLFDTMLAHYLLQPEVRHNMDVLAETYLHYQPISITELIGKKGKEQRNMRNVIVDIAAEYAAEDADITLQLKNKLAPQLARQQLEKLFNEVEIPLLNVLADIERNGVKVDNDSLANYSNSLAQDLVAIEKKIYQIAGEKFNIASPKQLGIILFEKLKLVEKPKKTKTGQYATGEDILLSLSAKHNIVQHILDFREYQKLKSTYVDALPTLISPKDGLIHTSYNQAVASTGRLSSTNPNLQNIPIRTARGREIRKAFVARSAKHLILSADYSQIELRIMAAFSQDEHMINAFREGRDIHAATAAKIYGVPLEHVDAHMRRKAKMANFGIIYGISAFGLAQRLNISRGEATEIIDTYFGEFKGVKQYMDTSISFARQNHYVQTILGRKRHLRDINSHNYTTRSFAERNAINAPIQGSAADLIKVAMINIHQWMKAEKLQSKMIMQVHDELIFDVYCEELQLMCKKIKQLMENAVPMSVPICVDIGTGKSWLEAH